MLKTALAKNATRLEIANENNKLYCNVFTHISLAPTKEIDRADPDKIYVITRNGTDIYVKLLWFNRTKFWWITDTETMLAHGIHSMQWRTTFKKKYPNAEETQLAIYVYQRID